MEINPVLEKLGYPNDARLAILHTDDLGMCGASIAAYPDLLDAGIISSAAAMVPCSWFPAVAEFCRGYPGELDIGVHITLTSEWSGYRWAPLSTRDPDTGLVDDEGYFPSTLVECVAKAQPEAVKKEMRTQVMRMLSAGIDITHIDTHMGATFHTAWVQDYISLAMEHGLALNLPRLDVEAALEINEIQEMGESADDLKLLLGGLVVLESQGLPLLDGIYGFPLDEHEGRLGLVKHIFNNLSPGITLLINHAAMDTPELRAVTPDWRGRVADYECFTSKEASDIIRQSGVQLIGYRALRDVLRSNVKK
jgi:predicted glycoside hydrolase/deacetylase ChbG (UPF0249 family)